MVYTIGTVEFDGVEETPHYVRPEINVHTRTGSNNAIVQVRRHTSPPFTLRAWVHLAENIAPDTHLYTVLALIGKKSIVSTDTALLTGDNPYAADQALLVQDVRYRVRNRRGRAFIEYELECTMTEDEED